MVMFIPQRGESTWYSPSQIGQDDGQSTVESIIEKVVCNRCGAEYSDEQSVEQVKKWLADGYSPCPNLSCPGELEVKGEKEV